MSTQARLASLIKAETDAGRKVEWLEVDNTDRASLIEEVHKGKGDLAKKMKTSGIDVAMPTLQGVPLRWNAAKTQTKLKDAAEGGKKTKR